ncbi:PREDICTED: uncharacterized protein LOC106818607 [Priapulus caudatus]|uniref:HECT-type E3 ubiquitin transferase n=1 Tax=Priapulus caudatus TaxID=37621 RepID=A0ABM1F2W5_PRICU|nr:PREDICTED: uncharacterized protein LOC106818607 [Priapulus caudatus]
MWPPSIHGLEQQSKLLQAKELSTIQPRCQLLKFPILTWQHVAHLLVSNFIDLTDPDEEEMIMLIDDDDQEMADILAAQHNSMLTLNEFQPSNLEEVLRIHKALTFAVRRKHIMTDAFRRLQQIPDPHIFKTKSIKIIFVGEPAVDEGGPTREFFTEVFRSIRKSSLMTDRDNLSHNVLHLSKQHYKLVGQLIALSIMNSGPNPLLFCRPTAEHILNSGQLSEDLSIEDVSDAQLREHLLKIANMENEEEFVNYVEQHLERRHDIGYSKVLSLQDKSDLSLHLIKDDVICRCSAELQQLDEGLTCLDVLPMMRRHPSMFLPVMMKTTEPLAATDMGRLFTPVHSVEGSNKREAEEEIMVNWYMLLEALNDGAVNNMKGDETITMSMTDLLMFVTGMESLPIEGFSPSNPEIHFDHVTTQRKITANTCGLILSIPVNANTISAEPFQQEMLEAVVNGQGFGQP